MSDQSKSELTRHKGTDPWAVPVWFERAASWAWRAIVICAGAYLLLRALSALRVVFLPIFIAALLAAFAAPIRNGLRKVGVPHTLASLAIFVAVSGIIGAGIWLVVISIGDQLIYEAQWGVVQDDVESWLMNGPASLSEADVTQLEERIQSSLAGGAWSVGLDRVGLLTSLVGASVLTVVLFFLFLKDGNSLWRWTMGHLRPDRRKVVDEAGRAAVEALTGYARGAAFAGVMDGAAIGAALVILDVPLALPLAVLTFFAAFFPIVGATFAGGVAVIVALVFNDPQAAIIVGVVVLAIQQFEGNVLVPVIMKRQVRLHPSIVLISLAAGAAAAGVAGAFVAVPLVTTVAAAAGAFGAPGGAEAAQLR